ncbi:TrkH family potassium uptake protein [Priestia flexa]|jgi:trk system potassium uptake protein|uniref:Ktr system potassium transporter B n=3 Tax=Priestia flexa TaxID=86664 RepID=A0A8I1MG78_9BACI|nr:TrkH family potassium uptake protein [Priestia flexa]MBN8251791.1 Ktr system potassium transporter B [Priestia flexa]MBN8434793.1 Ktr system potassium transporter B [Priestia flexa]MCA0967571.1 TrkH family potassium uptake protein [Priestia flexa]
MSLARSIKLTPPQLLTSIFGGGIIIGALLLMLPFSTTEPISWIDALFTSTSAMTVTGLAVVDTGTRFTVFGQTIIMLLIQVGGLGIMSFAVLIFIMLGKKIGFKERMMVQQALNQTNIGGVILLVKRLFIFSFVIELIALIFLAIRWVPEFGWEKGLFFSLFHSISAFNNAGFGLLSDSLVQYAGDPLINITISLLFIIGGIGFTVLADLWEKKSYKKLSLHSKLMIIGTFIINTVAMLFIFFLEYGNAKTLGSLSLGDKMWTSYFQAVSTRTAGFNSIDIANLTDSTAFLMIILMFIGAGSASTGGGIKLTTFIVITFAVLSFIRGREDIVLLKRRLSTVYVVKALAISMIAIMFVFFATFAINITEPNTPFLKLMFEVVSAFGTVGLSMGVTPELSYVGRVIIIFIMFLGKIGPLTLAFSLAKPKREKIRYPNEDVLIG